MRSLKKFGAIAILLFAAFSSINAQTASRGQIFSGSVTDGSGAAVSGAIVSAKLRGQANAVSVSTDAAGGFELPGLLRGVYEITVEHPGFSHFSREIEVGNNPLPEASFQLLPNAEQQTVTVVAHASPVLESPSGQLTMSVGRDDFKNAPAFSIGDIFGSVPGVTVLAGNGPRDVSISIRGSNDRSAFGIHNVQVFEDGFPVTQPDGLARTDLTDPHAYDGIDVTQGPSSALYGNNATGGAINFHTRPGVDVQGLEVGADFGSFNYFNDYATLGGATEKAQYFLFASNVRSDQFTQHSGFNTVTGNLLVSFALSPRDRLQFKFIDNELNTNLPIRLSLNQYQLNPYQKGCANLSASGCASVSLFANGFNGTTVAASADQAGLGRFDRRTIVGVRFEHDLTDQTLWRSQLVFDNKNFNQPQTAMTTRGAFPSFNLLSDLTRTGTLLGRRSTSYAAGSFTYENTNPSLTYNLDPQNFGGLGGLTQSIFGSQLTAGFRVREEINLTHRLLLAAGLGVEHASFTATEQNYTYPSAATATIGTILANRHFFNVAPDASLQYQASDALRLHAHLGTGYGTPQIPNLFVTAQGVFGNNTQLKTQRNVGLDEGADWSITRGLQFGVTGFYEWFHNEMVMQSAGANLQAFTFNVPESLHRGLETTVDWRPLTSSLPGLRFSASYLLDRQIYNAYTEVLSAGNLSSSFNRSKDAIPGIIPNYLHVRLGYDPSSGKAQGWGAYLESNFRDAYFVDNANLLKAPCSTLMNLDLHYEAAESSRRLSHVRIYFELQNLMNRTYVASASNISDSISATTGAESDAAVLAGTTGSIYAGLPRASFGGIRFKF